MLRIDPAGGKLSLRLSTGSKFLDSQLTQGSFSVTKSIEGNGPQDVLIDRNDFKLSGKKSKAGEVIDWSRISRFDLVIIDKKTNKKINLASKDGSSMLQLIALVEPQSRSLQAK